MPNPFDELNEEERDHVLDRLREILRHPDRQEAEKRRRALADELAADHPSVAAWVAEDEPAAEARDEHPVLSKLDVEPARVRELEGRLVVVKYGGNAMVDEQAKQNVIGDVCALKHVGAVPVIVHGGGPAISELLGEVGVESHFVEGHRKTDRSMMGYVEMALSGKVNSEIVKLIGFNGYKSVGISGKDGALVTARKRIHTVREAGNLRRSDLGQVGDVESIDTDLLDTLVKGGYIPVVAPIGVGEDLEDYNINADMFAGHVAAALKAAAYVALTDVDGIFIDKDDPSTLIPEFSAYSARDEIGRIVQGGMIPKVESCLIALEGGVSRAHIVNGMSEHALLAALLTKRPGGTTLRAEHD
jgi:acetylglutamate kinase